MRCGIIKTPKYIPKEKYYETKKCQDVYGEPEIFYYPNAVVKVYHPILTEEERERRMERIKEAAVRLILSAEESKRKKNQNQ